MGGGSPSLGSTPVRNPKRRNSRLEREAELRERVLDMLVLEERRSRALLTVALPLAIIRACNNTLRKCLDYQTPAEVFHNQLRLLQNNGSGACTRVPTR